MSLTKPSVSEMELEKSVLDLFAEFLGQYFDGNAHDVGENAAVAFPECALNFQQAAPPQPLKGALISVVWNAPVAVRKYWNPAGPGAAARQQLAEAPARWLFLVRAEADEKGQAKALCLDAAQKLFGLMSNAAATRALAQKGIHQLKAMTPALVSDTGYVIRQVPVTGLLRWVVRSQHEE